MAGSLFKLSPLGGFARPELTVGPANGLGSGSVRFGSVPAPAPARGGLLIFRLLGATAATATRRSLPNHRSSGAHHSRAPGPDAATKTRRKWRPIASDVGQMCAERNLDQPTRQVAAWGQLASERAS